VPATARSRDRDILKLAIPALGALAAEPTYLLVDTAIVGHLGTTQLAALALSSAFLMSAFWVFNFLAYGSTAQISRLHGSGDDEQIGVIVAQGLWLALGIGFALVILGELFTPQIISLMQGTGEVAVKAETYMRISFLGAPFVMIVLAGEGWARGVQKMSVPLKILIVSNIVNVVLELVFVFGLDWDIAGSAWGTVIAQAGAAAAFGVVLLRAAKGQLEIVWAKMKPLLQVGRDLMIRTGSILATFVIITALLASKGEAGLAANQVLQQLDVFIALALDSIAVAAQSLVGSRLGAFEVEDAREYARRVTRMCAYAGVAVAAILAIGHTLIPQAFTNDAAVLAQVARVWWLFCFFNLFSALVFGWDGVLMGAGDMRFLMWGMLAGAVVCLSIAFVLIGNGHGIVGAWVAFTALNGVRFLTNGWRVRGNRWAVPGAAAA
jgi:putative MATE family efflux protein